MNKVILMGRLTRDQQIRYTQGEESLAIARFTLAVDRRVKSEDLEHTLNAKGEDVKNKELWQQYRKLAAGHTIHVVIRWRKEQE